MTTEKTNTELVAEIHDSFYTAGEKALNEAKSILSKPKINVAEIKARYEKIGFSNAKAVLDAVEQDKMYAKQPEVIHAIGYFGTYYPSYKFILEEDAKAICEKYGLLLGDSKNYKGDIPEKNLLEIEKFSLREEDMQDKTEWEMGEVNSLGMFTSSFPSNMIDRYGSYLDDYSRASSMLMLSSRRYNSEERRMQEEYNRVQKRLYEGLFSSFTPSFSVKKDSVKTTKYKPEFKICAPKHDFNTIGYEVKEGYKLVYDPVVLQPVKCGSINGYLIVSAWGDEASDEIVVNQKMN